MKHTEFTVPRQSSVTNVARLIEHACSHRGLQLGMKGSSAAFPASTHWHYKKKGEKGTLELTFYPAERRLWAEVKESRSAPWIARELPELMQMIERELKSRPRQAAAKRKS